MQQFPQRQRIGRALRRDHDRSDLDLPVLHGPDPPGPPILPDSGGKDNRQITNSPNRQISWRASIAAAAVVGVLIGLFGDIDSWGLDWLGWIVYGACLVLFACAVRYGGLIHRADAESAEVEQ